MYKWINEYSTEEFKNKFHYDGKLGAIYSKEETEFIIWTPVAKEVSLIRYDGNDKIVYNMKKGEKGQWSIKVRGDLKNIYYNYLINIDNEEREVVDPYAKAVGVNGERSMVVDLEDTNPAGWDKDIKPELKSATDAILYEMHIRDFSIDENSGVKSENRGKYLGLVEEGTVIPGTDIKTTLDHLKELGITHVHLLPTFDYKSVDESKLDIPQYNWGYDPQNYNCLEGSYSSNPYDGEVRIKEFKKAIQKLHEYGIRVVMDVVYNHTFDTGTNCLNLAVPYYYHRTKANGEFSDGSACGNEIASERSMVRKYMVDSVKYFAEEYHVDGFRFDLMGLHDIETMKEIRLALDNVDKSIIMYGEGWAGGESPLPKDEAALKLNAPKYGELQIASFSDDMRDGIKGDVFISKTPGFINGRKNQEETIKAGVIATVAHDEIDYSKVIYSDKPWANEPYQTVNYDSAHDNYTLWDKLNLSSGNVTKEELIAMNKLSAAIVLTSQGIPFLHAGEEFLRSKVREDGSFEENSYKSSDSVNKLEWKRKEEYIEVFNYYKGLIELRKRYKEFRLNSTRDIKEKISFLKKGENFKEDWIVGFNIKGENEFIVIYNSNKNSVDISIPEGKWQVLVNDNKSGSNAIITIDSNKVKVKPLCAYVIKKEN